MGDVRGSLGSRSLLGGPQQPNEEADRELLLPGRECPAPAQGTFSCTG
jgi:hypothetical protein